MTVPTSARRLSVVLLATLLIVLPLVAGCATNKPPAATAKLIAPAAPNQAANSKSAGSLDSHLIVAGRLDCKTNEVEVTGGVIERGRFENLDALSALLDEKGYGRAALAEINDLKACSLGEDDFKRFKAKSHGEVATAEWPSALLLKFQLNAPYVSFALGQFDFSDYPRLSTFLAQKEEQKACERINERCVVCPDKNIYCVKPGK